MKKLHLSIATEDYDHFRDFRTGAVQAEGIEHTWLMPELHEIFARFTFNREWDVSELSFAKFSTQVTRKNADITALPVVCSRHFRFSAFYVNKKSKIKTPKDLKGKKVGSPEWAHTAAVYMRGWLNDEHGVGLKDIDWYQAGTNEPGRTEKVEINLPKGVRLTRVDDSSLSEMLAKGELDCALVARPPDCFQKGHPDIVRLFPDFQQMEEQYYARTKIWPIMHVVAIKKQILEQHPWVAGSLYNAFNESKNRALGRMFEQSVSRYPLPWLTVYARRMRDMFGGDPFPFGIDENRATFEQFLRYVYEQGIAHRHAKVEEIFPAGMMVEHKT
jgi:4,5-dihydroxyphthalate decarboxylase